MKKEKSISKNVILSIVKNIFSLLFPLITFPYITKVLGVENIGKYNFSNSIISYFLLLASLGISNYALREASMIRDDNPKLKKFVSEIFTINCVSTAFVYILFVLCILFIPKLKGYSVILIILSVQIFLTTIGIEWIFSVFEDFYYITIRTILFQFISLILLLLFVRDSNDLYIYVLILVVSSGGANILNFFNARKYVKFTITSKPNFKKHLRSILIIFGTAVACTIYVNSDITILGFMTTDYNVGLYSLSTKIYTIVKSLITAVLMVIVPRLSYYLGKNELSLYKDKLGQTLEVLTIFLLPIVTGLVFFSKEIILILSDATYLESRISLIILEITLLFCTFAIFAGQCVLLPLKKENIILKSTLFSAFINVTLNLVLIPFFKQNAAAFTTLLAECIAMIIQWKYVLEYVDLKKVIKNFLDCSVGCILVIISCLITSVINNLYLNLIVSIVISAAVYFLYLYFRNNKLVNDIINWMKNKIN